MEQQPKRKAKQKNEDAKEIEMRAILMKADEDKADNEIVFDDDDNISFKNEIDEMLDVKIDDPKEKYEFYYHVIDKLLRKHLPRGKENKSARDLIFEEKNTFLTRGHRKDVKGIRHADSRMSYNQDVKECAKIVIDWVFSKGTMYDLYERLRDLNKSKGYPLD